WPRGRPLAFGVGRPLHSSDRLTADALSRQLAHAGRGAEAPQHQRVACTGRRGCRLRLRGRLLPRIQEGIRCGTSHVAPFKQLGAPAEPSTTVFKPPWFSGLRMSEFGTNATNRHVRSNVRFGGQRGLANLFRFSTPAVFGSAVLALTARWKGGTISTLHE